MGGKSHYCEEESFEIENLREPAGHESYPLSWNDQLVDATYVMSF